MRAPDVMSCPEEASASKPAQEGFWFLWDVLSCLSGPGVLSCHVLFCVSSPGWLLIPPDFPKEILGGGRRGSGCRGRAEGTEAKAPKTICHGLQSSQLRHGLQSSQLRHGLQSSQLRHGLRCLFRSGGPRPVFLSVFVLRGLQSAHPPVELLRRGTRLPGGGSYVRVLLCVICSCLLCPYLVCFLSSLSVIIS